MRYGEDDRESRNVEDRRGRPAQGFPFPGGGPQIRIPVGRRGGGLSLTTLIILGALMLLFGINPLDLLQGGPGGGFPDFGREIQLPRGGPIDQSPDRQGIELPGRGERSASRSDDEIKRFVSRVLADTEDVWSAVFARSGRTYNEPKLVLFTGAVETHCGLGAAQVGPFYSDCLAGVWAKLTDQNNNRLEPGDIEEGLNAASRIGDDTLQRQMTGRVVPDAFTHGTSAQRVRWFRRGFDSGQMQACDTFSAETL